MNAITQFNKTELSTIKASIAKNLNYDEFNLFIQNAQKSGLDPFRGQIIPMVFSADDPKKRKMTMVISRDGLRCIASRCRDYRPASRPATIEADPGLKSAANPCGIISVTVYLHKQDPKSHEWFDVVGTAYWDEFAPLSYPYNAYDYKDTGDTWPNGKPKKIKTLKPGAIQELDGSGQWAKMPRLMITKAAEMQALRAGWPEEFDSLYLQEEMDAAQMRDITPSELADEAEQERLSIKLGHQNTLPVVFTEGLKMIPLGKYHDLWVKMLWEQKDHPSRILHFVEQNREGLNKFFVQDKQGALDLKARFEVIEKQMAKENAEAEKLQARLEADTAQANSNAPTKNGLLV